MNPQVTVQCLQSLFPTYALTLAAYTETDGVCEMSITVRNKRGSGESKCPDELDTPKNCNTVHHRGFLNGTYYVLQTLRIPRGPRVLSLKFACVNTEIVFRRATTVEQYKGYSEKHKWSAQKPH